MDIWTRLKDGNRIEDVATALEGDLGVRWRRVGQTWRAIEENSFYLDRRAQAYFRHNKGTSGSVIDLLVNELNMSLVEAGEYLAERLGVDFHQSPEDKAAYAKRRERQDVLDALGQYLREALLGPVIGRESALSWQDVIAHWAKQGRGDREQGAAYAAGRGISVATARRSGLGFWDGDRDALRAWLATAGVDAEHPAAVAITGFRGNVGSWGQRWRVEVRPNWQEHNTIWGMKGGMLVYAHQIRGKMRYFAGRSTDPQVEKRYKCYNPLQELMGRRRPLWNHMVEPDSRRVVVVEGQMDALTLAEWGIPAVALAGTSADDELLGQLAQFDRVYLGLDADDAGLKNVRKLVGALGPHCPLITWPQGDANDALQAGTSDAAILALLDDAPIYALWLAENRHALFGAADKALVDRQVMDQITTLAIDRGYEFATNRTKLAAAMGMGRPELDQVVKAIKQERQVDVEPPIKDTKPIEPGRLYQHAINYQEALPPDVYETMIKEARDHEGHTRCVLKLHGDQCAYVEEWGWLTYDGRRWDRTNGRLLVQALVTDTFTVRLHLALEREMDDLRKASKRSWRNISSVIKLLEPRVGAKVADFDAYPDLLNCQNGIVNLRTGQLMPHDPKYKFTYVIPVDYNEDADDPIWLDFLESVIDKGDDPLEMDYNAGKMLHFLQMATGYSLTGRVTENCLFYIFGPTRSGKGTFVQTLLDVLGSPVSSAIEFQSLVSMRKDDTQNFDLAGLSAARLVAAAESSKYERLNAAKIKQLTGADMIRCAFKRRDHFAYQPQFKIWLQSNFPINMDVYDEAVWGRVHVVRFPHSYLGREDKLLKQRLTTDSAKQTVLAWAIEGARMWYQSVDDGTAGLMVPDIVRAATAEQRAEQDFVQHFLDEVCDVADPNDLDNFVGISALYSEYQTWAKETGVVAMRQRTFSQAIKSKKFKSTRRRVRGRLTRGVVGIHIALDIGVDESQKKLRFGD